MRTSALITDFYELTMMQGYWLKGHNPQVVFEMFYRTNPFDGGYVLFTGLNDLIDKLEILSFDEEELSYLASLGIFRAEFLDYLRSYRFNGDIYAIAEGTVVFPNEPLLQVHTSLIDAQLLEGILLNTLNFQSLIATKASRMTLAAKGGAVMEFGLRRAQGYDGALSASRAAFIGGTALTSNTLAGQLFSIPVSGTMAHSWVMAFDSELEAFRTYAELYPGSTALLIDTYDTLGSGIDNAIIVGLEEQKKGHSIAVRIDSGDLSYLPRVIRKRLDDAGLTDTKIIVSNDLTEAIVQTLVQDEVPIDVWGIGTHLVTGGTHSSLNGVYKLAAMERGDGKIIPTMKISNSYEKTTTPGVKQVWRFYDSEGSALADLVGIEDEVIEVGVDYTFYHPFTEGDYFEMRKDRYARFEALLQPVMRGGKRVGENPPLIELQKRAKECLSHFHRTYLRQINPHIYKVSLTEHLKKMKMEKLIEERKKSKEGARP